MSSELKRTRVSRGACDDLIGILIDTRVCDTLPDALIVQVCEYECYAIVWQSRCPCEPWSSWSLEAVSEAAPHLGVFEMMRSVNKNQGTSRSQNTQWTHPIPLNNHPQPKTWTPPPRAQRSSTPPTCAPSSYALHKPKKKNLMRSLPEQAMRTPNSPRQAP
jgi:hypothetical protein